MILNTYNVTLREWFCSLFDWSTAPLHLSKHYPHYPNTVKGRSGFLELRLKSDLCPTAWLQGKLRTDDIGKMLSVSTEVNFSLNVLYVFFYMGLIFQVSLPIPWSNAFPYWVFQAMLKVSKENQKSSMKQERHGSKIYNYFRHGLFICLKKHTHPIDYVWMTASTKIYYSAYNAV